MFPNLQRRLMAATAQQRPQQNLELLLIRCDLHGGLSHIIKGQIKAKSKHIDIEYHNSHHLNECGIVNYS
jgi:hypothetical protein